MACHGLLYLYPVGSPSSSRFSESRDDGQDVTGLPVLYLVEVVWTLCTYVVGSGTDSLNT